MWLEGYNYTEAGGHEPIDGLPPVTTEGIGGGSTQVEEDQAAGEELRREGHAGSTGFR